MFFESWSGLVRVLVSGVLAYAALILLLRISGNRTLSKLNAFDLVVTVALGSTLATIILSKDVPLADGVLALATLIALQFLITWSSVRWPVVGRTVKSEPTLLVRDGQILEDQMQRARMVQTEVEAVVRQQGIARLDRVMAVVLETDGSVSVIPLSAKGSPDHLEPADDAQAPSEQPSIIPAPQG